MVLFFSTEVCVGIESMTFISNISIFDCVVKSLIN